MQTVFITGFAGFVGFHLSKQLLEHGYKVIGLDSFSDYYDVTLKHQRHKVLEQYSNNDNFIPCVGKVEDTGLVLELFETHKPDYVVHLAAQAGVRYSIDNPRAYLQANIIGTFEMLEAARAFPPKHMLLASTSSAFGATRQMPLKETQRADYQMSFYAATKKSNENMAHSYAHLFDLPVTMFRFFTVYGPWGRPDMALFKFTKAILDGQPIDIYNYGDMKRDFTYIQDLVEAVHLLMDTIPVRPPDGIVSPGDSLSPVAPYRVVNIGNSSSVEITDIIAAIEKGTGRLAKRNLMPMQPGDMPSTWADTSLLTKLTGYVPKTNIEIGIKCFLEWFYEYYKVT